MRGQADAHAYGGYRGSRSCDGKSCPRRCPRYAMDWTQGPLLTNILPRTTGDDTLFTSAFPGQLYLVGSDGYASPDSVRCSRIASRCKYSAESQEALRTRTAYYRARGNSPGSTRSGCDCHPRGPPRLGKAAPAMRVPPLVVPSAVRSRCTVYSRWNAVLLSPPCVLLPSLPRVACSNTYIVLVAEMCVGEYPPHR